MDRLSGRLVGFRVVGVFFFCVVIDVFDFRGISREGDGDVFLLRFLWVCRFGFWGYDFLFFSFLENVVGVYTFVCVLVFVRLGSRSLGERVVFTVNF